MSNPTASSSSGDPSGSRAGYGGPKIKKIKAAVSLSEKQKQGKSLDLSLKKTSSLLDALPDDFKDDSPNIEELRRLDLTGQANLFKNVGLGKLRFVGGTLTWLNLSGVDCGNAGKMDWMFLRMMETLFVLTMMHCNLEELPKELSSVKSLKALVASHNKLTSPCLSHLSPLKQLNSLILSDNQLTSFPSTTLNSLTSLKKLSLANNNLTSDGLPSFANVSATLEEIRLNGNSGITEIPELALEGNEASSSLSVLELSHTNIGDVKEIYKLQKLPKLINLGLRDTPPSRIDDYRTKITEMLPKLRILDNVRFDPLYLARKAKGKDTAADDHLQRRGKRGPLQSKHKQDEGWGGRAARDGADFKGKKRKMEDDGNDAEGAGGHPDARRRSQNKQDERGKSRGKSIQSPEDALPEQAQQDQETVHVPARKRSKKNKKKKQVTQGEEGIPAVLVKTPKAVGGSLSDPREASAKASKLDTSEVTPTTKLKPEAVDVHQLPKQISSVVGVVEVVASSKKSKDRSRKGHKSLKKGEAEKQEGEEKGKGDVLALLAQEKEKVASIGGWD